MTIEKNERDRRSHEQFQLFILNLTASGAIAAFALGDNGDPNALLIIPWFSFVTFSYWLYQAFSIRSADRKQPAKDDIWEWFRRILASISRLSCFALIPWGAVKLHSGQEYLKFKAIGSYLPYIILILYLFWFYFQYLKTFQLREPNTSIESD